MVDHNERKGCGATPSDVQKMPQAVSCRITSCSAVASASGTGALSSTDGARELRLDPDRDEVARRAVEQRQCREQVAEARLMGGEGGSLRIAGTSPPRKTTTEPGAFPAVAIDYQ